MMNFQARLVEEMRSKVSEVMAVRLQRMHAAANASKLHRYVCDIIASLSGLHDGQRC